MRPNEFRNSQGIPNPPTRSIYPKMKLPDNIDKCATRPGTYIVYTRIGPFRIKPTNNHKTPWYVEAPNYIEYFKNLTEVSKWGKAL